MKKLLALIAIFASFVFAADAPVVTTYLARIQTDPAAPNAMATAYFATTTTIGGQTFEAPWVAVSWQLADKEKAAKDAAATPPPAP